MTVEPEDTCKTCGRWTEYGRKKMTESAKKNPIFKTDFTRPLSELIEAVRNKLVDARGVLDDISAAFPVWKEGRLDTGQGLITGAISYLHHVKEEMQEQEKRQQGFPTLAETRVSDYKELQALRIQVEESQKLLKEAGFVRDGDTVADSVKRIVTYHDVKPTP